MDRKGKLDYRNSPLTEGASQNSSIPAKRPRFAMAAAPAQPPADRAEIADVAVIGAGVVGCAVARRLTLAGARVVVAEKAVDRSEEHTSELQSLMRISYAVFCLKKKTTHVT